MPINPTHRTPPVAALAASLAALLAPTLPAASASQSSPPPTQERTPAPILTEPFNIDDLGLRLTLPADVAASSASIPGGRTTTTILPAATEPDADEQRWIIRIYNVATADVSLTPADALNRFLAQRRATVERDPHSRFRVLEQTGSDDDPLRVGSQQLKAARAYAATTVSDAFFAGYTVVETATGSFIVFQLTSAAPAQLTDDGFTHPHRALFESIVASMEAEDPIESQAETMLRFETGAGLLQKFTADDLTKAINAIDEPVFLRFYRPGPTGAASDAEEIAFQKIEFAVGQLGQLQDGLPRDRWSPKQREFGFIVTVTARTQTGPLRADSTARYFLNNTMDEEFWSTTTTTQRAVERGRTVSSAAVETFVRRGPAITVSIDEAAAPPWTRDWNLAHNRGTRYYIPRVTLYLLPHLVADRFADEPTTLDAAFYAYDSSLRRLTRRTDSFDNLDSSGWTHISAPSPESGNTTTTLNSDGELVSRELANGIIVERTTPERLRRIWLDKGLTPPSTR